MAANLFLSILLLFSLAFLSEGDQSKLSLDYYQKTCPNFQDTIRKVILDKQLASPTTAAGVLRLFFHDCVVGGCDASMLIASNNLVSNTERDAEINLSLPGDGFDAITRVKTALELQCPGVVSCADILALAARDLVTIVGGPHYNVPLGRKDGLVSHAKDVDKGHIPKPEMPLSKIIATFSALGFSVREMVALVGAHTIGFSHCSCFSNRIFNFSKKSEVDPALHPKYAEGLRKLCANYTKDPNIAAFNDVMTPGKFDNMYYNNLKEGLGLLASDQAIATDARTKPFVDLYAANQTAFFEDFAHAMEKLSTYKVKMGKNGEVRRRCDAFNVESQNGNGSSN